MEAHHQDEQGRPAGIVPALPQDACPGDRPDADQSAGRAAARDTFEGCCRSEGHCRCEPEPKAAGASQQAFQRDAKSLAEQLQRQDAELQALLRLGAAPLALMHQEKQAAQRRREPRAVLLV